MEPTQGVSDNSEQIKAAYGGLGAPAGQCPHCGYCPTCGRKNQQTYWGQPTWGTVPATYSGVITYT
jgi:hypothetical protein